MESDSKKTRVFGELLDRDHLEPGQPSGEVDLSDMFTWNDDAWNGHSDSYADSDAEQLQCSPESPGCPCCKHRRRAAQPPPMPGVSSVRCGRSWILVDESNYAFASQKQWMNRPGKPGANKEPPVYDMGEDRDSKGRRYIPITEYLFGKPDPGRRWIFLDGNRLNCTEANVVQADKTKKMRKPRSNQRTGFQRIKIRNLPSGLRYCATTLGQRSERSFVCLLDAVRWADQEAASDGIQGPSQMVSARGIHPEELAIEICQCPTHVDDR